MANSNYNTGVIPVQKLPLSKKTKKWREATVDAFIGRTSTTIYNGVTEDENLRIKYDLYNSKFNIEDLEYVVDPFKVGDSFPASPQNYNIIRPKIDLLIGEESKKPFNMKVIQTDSKGMSKAEETEMGLLMRTVMAQIAGVQPNGQDVQTPEQIQEYMRYSYSDVVERTAHYALKYLKEKLNLSNEFLKGWKDGLIAGKEIYYVGIDGNDPFMERVNPIGFYFDKSPDLEFIEKGEWAVRKFSMTPGSIYDRFYDRMDDDARNKIMEKSYGAELNSGSDVNYSSVIYKASFDSESKSAKLEEYEDVYHVVWRSYKRIGFLTTYDENGEPIIDLVDETYKKSEGEEIEWEWVTEIWEGYRVGDNIYFGIEPLANQFLSIDNLNNNNLPYYGVLYSDTNSEYTSLVDIMKPLQYIYIIIWYRLETALARDKGKVLNMDITQIPKSFGMDVSKWAHYLSALGVNFINPYEEGWDVPGRAGGAASAFNQIGSQDLTMSKVIADYVALMDKVEQMVGELTGVTRQRQGAISSDELVGNVQRSVVQSSHTTEPLFWKHNQVKKNIMNAILDCAKVAWASSDKKYLHFILDDTARTYIKLTKDFPNSMFDVFVTDSSDEDLKLQKMQSLIGPAISSGASLAEAAEAIVSDNLTEMKNKLIQIDTKRQQLEQQKAEQDRQVQLQIQQKISEDKANELRIKEEDSIRRASTDIEVALIQAEKANNNSNSMDTVFLNKEKVRLQQLKQDEDARKNKAIEDLKRKELEIKRRQANKPSTTSK